MEFINNILKILINLVFIAGVIAIGYGTYIESYESKRQQQTGLGLLVVIVAYVIRCLM